MIDYIKIVIFDPGSIDGIFSFKTKNVILRFEWSIGQIETTGVADIEIWYALRA